MKIERAKLHIVRQKLGEQSFCYSQAWYNTRTMLLLEMTTDDGIVGWGEAFGNPFVNKAILEQVYLPRILGKNPVDRGVIWRDLYNCLRDHGQKGATIEAISAVDLALWDIAGKYTHMPAYQMLGGAARSFVQPYATGFYRREGIRDEELVEEALQYKAKGFLGMKIKVGFGVDKDVRLVREIRKAVGPETALMLDANHAYNACDALRLARGVEECNIAWLEEPVPPEDIEGYCEVKQKTTIPIAGGEAEFTRYGFARLLQHRAVDIVQPDCCVTGGLSEFSHIAMLASIHDIRCCPHIWGSGVAMRAGLNAAFSLPDYPDSLNPAPVWLELDRTPNIFREELNQIPLKIQNGKIHLEHWTGLGFEPNREIIKAYQVDETEVTAL